ncbi:MAG: hypothetical protein DMF57_07260 [Acidobacteria bacterium]|nr:MAG: hypothetical protein DMF57_07260 [Acidobacteriota bacterium]
MRKIASPGKTASHHASFGVATAILIESALSFLGIGVLPHDAVGNGKLLQHRGWKWGCLRVVRRKQRRRIDIAGRKRRRLRRVNQGPVGNRRPLGI